MNDSSRRELYQEIQRTQNVLPLRLSSGQIKTRQPSPTAEASGVSTYNAVKRHVHQQILKQVNIARFDPEKDRDIFRALVSSYVVEFLSSVTVPLTREQKERLVEDTISEAVGLGPLSVLFEDPAVSDILVNGPYEVYVERFGRLEATDIRFDDDAHLLNLIERIVSRVGRHIDQNSPMVDARLPDGSRVNAIIPPLSLNGPALSIRRFGHKHLMPEEMIRLGAFTEGMLQVFQALVSTRHNIQISGGTGSGKTTLLNALSSFISNRERIITIEDAAELRLQKEHVIRLEARPANIEGRGKITIRDLVVNALRMRPDRIVVGEIRGGEAFDMLQAMSTGHEGGMTTIHANTPRDSLKRVESMVLMTGFELPAVSIRQIIAGALDILIHVDRMPDGTRKVTSVSEVVGLEKDTILLQEIFTFERQEVREHRVIGRHVSTGVRPKFCKKCELGGFSFAPALFEKGRPC